MPHISGLSWCWSGGVRDLCGRSLPRGSIMNVLVFTSLYPNNVWPHHGVFVKERMTTFAQIEGCNVKVVAPVPYFPPIKLGHRSGFSQITPREVIEGLEVYHP